MTTTLIEALEALDDIGLGIHEHAQAQLVLIGVGFWQDGGTQQDIDALDMSTPNAAACRGAIELARGKTFDEVLEVLG